MAPCAVWYFDFMSPFAYLQWQRLKAVPGWVIECRPLLFAALLSHHGQKGPAEMASKRVFTYRHVQWRAERDGIPLCFPPAHPFNPLASLRLCVAAGATPAAVDTVFDFIWREGACPDTPEGIRELAGRLGIEDEAMVEPAVRARLQRNFEQALEDGVFGVPSLVKDAEVFWGDDATDMFAGYLADPGLFKTPSMECLASLRLGAVRPGGR